MRSDVKLLVEHRAYLSLTTIIVCCLDALAAGPGRATKPKFKRFVTSHFPELCADLERSCPGKTGAATLYEAFRNGFAHLRGPQSGFAIAEDHELGGAFADEFTVDGLGRFVGLNVDRLAREFVALLDQLEKSRPNEGMHAATQRLGGG